MFVASKHKLDGRYYVLAASKDIAIHTLAITVPYSVDVIPERYTITQHMLQRPLVFANPEWINIA